MQIQLIKRSFFTANGDQQIMDIPGQINIQIQSSHIYGAEKNAEEDGEIL